MLWQVLALRISVEQLGHLVEGRRLLRCCLDPLVFRNARKHCAPPAGVWFWLRCCALRKLILLRELGRSLRQCRGSRWSILLLLQKLAQRQCLYRHVFLRHFSFLALIHNLLAQSLRRCQAVHQVLLGRRFGAQSSLKHYF